MSIKIGVSRRGATARKHQVRAFTTRAAIRRIIEANNGTGVHYK
jgi:hypothetical protein